MLLAYIDCFAGLSGETLLEALIGAGLSREQVDNALAEVSSVQPQANGHAKSPTLSSFRKSVAASALPPLVKQAVSAVLNRLHEAEASVQNKEEHSAVHVMGWQECYGGELKAAVGVVLGLSLLGIGRVECSPVRVGGGPVGSNGKQAGAPRHAFSPVTAEILCGASVPVYGSDQDSDFVTPVGAALVTTLASHFGPLPPMTIRAIGYGKDKPGSDGSAPPPRQTRLFIGERASVEAAPLEIRKEQSRPVSIKVESTHQTGIEISATQPVLVQSAPEEQTTNGNGHTDKVAPTPKPYIAPLEDWVALSIKGHQQSGRQRL